jgi:serine/threonine-protein kinase
MDLVAGTVVGERYRIDGPLGEGGMAVVYAVTHEQLGTRHALKVLTLNSRSVRDRMLQEGRFQAKLSHPNIVAVTDVVALNDSPCLVMELIDGPGLDELIAMQVLTLDQADTIGRGILSAVAHAHGLGLIHRDLKPANIMLQIVDQTAIPKVTDFGLAKLLDGQDGRAATRTGSTMGTPQYMSPEQIQDAKNVDERGDVFALAAILYELLTGRRAFDGDNVLEIFQAIDRGEYTPPLELREDAPERMVAAIVAGLKTDRDERCASVEELYALWTGGEALAPHATTAVTLGTLPSLAEFNSVVPEAPTQPPRRGLSALLLGGGVAALLGAGGVIVVLLLALAVLWMRPGETQIIRVPVEVPVEVPVDPAAVPVDPAAVAVDPAAVPATEDDTDLPTPEPEEGVPWEDLVGPDGEVRTPQPAEPAPAEPDDEPDPEPSTPETSERSRAEQLVEAMLAAKGLDRVDPGRKVLTQWSVGPGPIPEHRAIEVIDAAGAVKPSFLKAYGSRGTSLQPPAQFLSGHSRAVSNAAARALEAVARRRGTQDEALRILLENEANLGQKVFRNVRQSLE